MTNYIYESRIDKSESGYYAIVVCLDLKTGHERVAVNYRARFFKTLSGAEKSTQKHIKKFMDSLN